ncbi:MAG: SUMF1/EgtB/PvdO family nonheme iron enzyme, partial [Synechococcales bacterium]|nr:SUMF1/EgtB/PvdO family nonheme iron enzyme [Synechococcales bacterium]
MPDSTNAKITHPTIIKQEIYQWMNQCRSLTLDLLQVVDDVTLCTQVHPDYSPIGWHIGHIGYTEALWILEHVAQQPLPYPEYRQLYAQDGLPKRDRTHLPPLQQILNYLAAIRAAVFKYLEIADIATEEHIWRFLLQHESQHCETIAILLALRSKQYGHHHPAVPALWNPELLTKRGATPGNSPETNSILPDPNPSMQEVLIPAGGFWMGSEAIDALDNERSCHWVELPDYYMDVYPVTQREFGKFIQTGGYQQSEFWSAEGWQWLQQQNWQLEQQLPTYWCGDEAFKDYPVQGVSWYEADAYAKFVGKRLPTEAEWEKAMSWDGERSRRFPWGDAFPMATTCNHGDLNLGTSPVQAHPDNCSFYGCRDGIGNGWEWTDSWFAGYPGFTAFPYRGYSQAYFDQAHRVLRGGSWVTRPWAMRNSFRNWYHPWTREIFASFRCARSA